MNKKEEREIHLCGARTEQKEHRWATPTQALQIATDHGVKEYPQCAAKIKRK